VETDQAFVLKRIAEERMVFVDEAEIIQIGDRN
jgi:hypothetical protein